ncbi:hypothetical protein B0O99DRAFT_641511 [Bisporella sp. PMI_857]|nr:hypothetical protein B0O99DRAFT_641511 [Bisporella sp. PMI_857]
MISSVTKYDTHLSTTLPHRPISNLDVGRLRQKRYNPNTQGRLDWVKEHHAPHVDQLWYEVPLTL